MTSDATLPTCVPCRTTILPSEKDIEHVAKDLSDFHTSFLKKYKD